MNMQRYNNPFRSSHNNLSEPLQTTARRKRTDVTEVKCTMCGIYGSVMVEIHSVMVEIQSVILQIQKLIHFAFPCGLKGV